ncbi:MAG: ABC transporter permease [Candidatus Alcyoniella australis]|nr:ABC transporter permease [Candidatus Alcyoniella australis]
MNDWSTGVIQALHLLFSGDPQLWTIVWTSLWISLCSTLLASCAGVPAGVLLALRDFRGRETLISVLHTMLALPTVVIGLFCYVFISRQGPLGEHNLLFSPAGIIIGQTLLIFPIVVTFSHSALAAVSRDVRATALTLGAGAARASLSVVNEARFGIMAALTAAFGRAIGEVGISMMLGGNIKGFTRTITTAIALETSKGEFALGLGLGVVLIAFALTINLTTRRLGKQGS